MSVKLLDAVYCLDRSLTTPSEQAVLAALAFRANEKDNYLCYPTQKNLVQMTHLSRGAIQDALNGLAEKERGFLSWVRGGFKGERRKGGQLKSNDYKINVAKIFEQASRKATAKDVNSDINRVVNSDATVCTSDTPQCAPDAHDSVHELNTAVYTSCTPTEIITEDKKPKYNRKESGSGLSIGNGFDAALSDMGIAQPPTKEERLTEQQRQAKEESTTEKLLRICGIEKGTKEYKANVISFTKMLLKIDAIYPGRAREVVYQFESEMRQGEMKGIRNLAAYFMKRLKDELPPTPPNP